MQSHQQKKASPSPLDKNDNARESFGARLRRERERRNISIASIADSTKILGALLEGLENDDVSRWPIGFYRRAFLRSYATAIGLDPEETWLEFAARHPEPQDTLSPAAPEPTDRRARLRVTLADRVAWFAGGPVLERVPARIAAVTFDLVIVGVAAIFSFVALGQFWVPLSIAAVSYFCGGVLVLGNTPGVCLFAPTPGGQGKAAAVPRVDGRARAGRKSQPQTRGPARLAAVDLVRHQAAN